MDTHGTTSAAPPADTATHASHDYQDASATGPPPADSGGIQDATGVNSTDKDVPDRDSQDDSHDNSRSDDADSNPPQHDAVSTPTRRSDSADDDNDVDLREPWVEYIQRATRRAEQLMKFHHID